jgi:hypothetical protein
MLIRGQNELLIASSAATLLGRRQRHGRFAPRDQAVCAVCIRIGAKHAQRHVCQMPANLFCRTFAASRGLHDMVVAESFGAQAGFVNSQRIVSNHERRRLAQRKILRTAIVTPAAGQRVVNALG